MPDNYFSWHIFNYIIFDSYIKQLIKQLIKNIKLK